eukprot:TRINITY_DN2244_c0_g1_i1.p1 TRINITY_DN2244_c0_g1~~TRINITY_DN2244_c0_g1_i1.p1  ORF type:complete len:552 (+),score=167.33 TRINITY_DN2244_c0_g1_i1:216-1658(+)
MDFMYNTPLGMQKPSQEAPIQIPDTPSVGPAISAVHPKNTVSHPVLANVPKEGDYVDKLEIKNYRPLGHNIRHVRCARCGQKGHASGDRECPLADVNPNDAARKRAEDPAIAMMNLPVPAAYNNHLVLKDHLLKDQIGEDSGFIQEPEPEDLEKAFFDSLSKKQIKRLLKQLEKEENKTKKKKKSKSKKRKHSSSSESSSEPPKKRKKEKLAEDHNLKQLTQNDEDGDRRDGEMDRDVQTERDGDRERERGADRDREKERDTHRDRDRDGDRDRERGFDRDREKERDTHRERDTQHRDRDRERGRDREENRERGDKGSDRDRDTHRDREGDRGRDREENRERGDKGNNRDGDRDRDRERDRDRRDRDRERYRHSNSRSHSRSYSSRSSNSHSRSRSRSNSSYERSLKRDRDSNRDSFDKSRKRSKKGDSVRESRSRSLTDPQRWKKAEANGVKVEDKVIPTNTENIPEKTEDQEQTKNPT